jgi:hypothetical protein
MGVQLFWKTATTITVGWADFPIKACENGKGRSRPSVLTKRKDTFILTKNLWKKNMTPEKQITV